jgi:hypothetical protein
MQGAYLSGVSRLEGRRRGERSSSRECEQHEAICHEDEAVGSSHGAADRRNCPASAASEDLCERPYCDELPSLGRMAARTTSGGLPASAMSGESSARDSRRCAHPPGADATTSSLSTCAARLTETIAKTAKRGGAPIHVIGHSGGGLDVRLLAAPGIALPSDAVGRARPHGRHVVDTSARDLPADDLSKRRLTQSPVAPQDEIQKRVSVRYRTDTVRGVQHSCHVPECGGSLIRSGASELVPANQWREPRSKSWVLAPFC